MKSHTPGSDPRARDAYVSTLRRTRFDSKWILVISSLLLSLGVLGAVATRAQTYNDAIVAIGNVDGGFYNGIQVIEPSSSTIVGQVKVELPTLPGCNVAQPRAFLDDLALFASSKSAYASVRACPGGTLSDNQALARFDAGSGRFIGFVKGPGSGSRILKVSETTLIALSADGTRATGIDVATGRVLAERNFGGGFAASRWGIGSSGELLIVSTNGTVKSLGANTLEGQDLGQMPDMDLPFIPEASDAERLVRVGSAFYTFAWSNKAWYLVSRDDSGTIKRTELGAQPVSLVATPDKSHLFIATGCPAGVSCPANPNRIYAYNVQTQALEQSGSSAYIPLQTSPHQLRFNTAGTNMYFDGVVSGANGVSQRFVFSADPNSSVPGFARTPVTGSRWEVASIDVPTAPPIPVSVPPGVASGGGIGLNDGSIAQAPVPLDQIERLIGVSLAQIDWSKVTDEQIRAFGYDPAAVRRYITQWQYTQQANTVTVAGCDTVAIPDELKSLQSKVGVPLTLINIDDVTDDQIKQFGFEPSSARTLFKEYQTKLASQSNCSANVFTQDSFVAANTSEADTSQMLAGTVANPTVQTVFDLLKGGWLMRLRWQAPGGAKKFVIYGRDTKTHQREQKLAIVDSSQRAVSFGGFGHLGLPAFWHDEQYTLAVVPQKENGVMGIPVAAKVRVRCVLGVCVTSK